MTARCGSWLRSTSTATSAKLAMRRARSGFLGWIVDRTTKTGRAKVSLLDRGDAQAKAREYLAGANRAVDVPGAAWRSS
jgi:hypothetical protein